MFLDRVSIGLFVELKPDVWIIEYLIAEKRDQGEGKRHVLIALPNTPRAFFSISSPSGEDSTTGRSG